jgi:hypothetical protein
MYLALDDAAVDPPAAIIEDEDPSAAVMPSYPPRSRAV